MSDFFSAFKKASLEEWRDQIIADLKGKDPSILDYHDLIEEINYRAYYHKNDMSGEPPLPGNYPLTRGLNNDYREWDNMVNFEVTDENADNQKALKLLMSGVNAFIFNGHSEINWNKVLVDIQLEYLKCQFKINDYTDFRRVHAVIGQHNTVAYNYDFFAAEKDELYDFAQELKQKQQPTLLVNSYAVQQCGANSTQELAFALNVGHEYLLRLMQEGLTIDEASACIHFHMGIGNDYFIEIAKFRTFRMLWAKLVNAYKPEHSCSTNCRITGLVGFSNKSLIDPYTNLLRQTTEAMSALQGGADSLVIMPYDYTSEKPTELAARMAINISNILKEESYFDKVLDPAGGGYSIEKLTLELGKNAWSVFQKLESEGGLFQAMCKEKFVSDVLKKRELRIKQYQEKEKTLIGVNKFHSNKPFDNNWMPVDPYMKMERLILEQEIKTEIHEQS